jgi:membrane protein DedA with SNARE-associated domain
LCGAGYLDWRLTILAGAIGGSAGDQIYFYAAHERAARAINKNKRLRKWYPKISKIVLKHSTIAHEGLGVIFVLAACSVAAIGARAGAPRGLVTVTLLWGIITVLFGYTQVGLMPGSMHWLIRGVHLLLGLGLAGQVERVAKAVKQA